MGVKRRNDDNDSAHVNTSEVATGGLEPPRKKLQAYDEVDAKLAQLYSDLADEVKSTRLTAGKAILQIVDTSNGARTEKILKRLVRGLCSNRKAARLGFVVILTEVIAHRVKAALRDEESQDQLEPLLKVVDSETSYENAASNQEKKEHLLGRCLAYTAIVQSRLVSFCPQDQGLITWGRLLDRVFDLYGTAPSLRQECGSAANGSLTSGSLPAEFAEVLISKYQSHGLIKSAEGLAAWLHVQEAYPTARLPDHVWHKNDPFASKNRPDLVRILRDGAIEMSIGESSSANTNSRTPSKSPSPAWAVVLRAIGLKRMKPDQFSSFWAELVNDAYFSAKASVERKVIGLQVVELAAKRMQPVFLDRIVPPNVIRSIVNSRSSTSNYLYVPTSVLLRALVERAKTSSEAALAFLRAILGSAGITNFDRLTQTKTLEDLLNATDVSDARAVVATIRGIIVNPVVSEHLDADTSRKNSADLLLLYARKLTSKIAARNLNQPLHTLVNSRPSDGEDTWKPLLQVLLAFAYTKPSQQGIELSVATRNVFQARLMSVLNVVLDSKQDLKGESLEFVVTSLRDAQQSDKLWSRIEADEHISNVFAGAYNKLQHVSRRVKGDHVGQNASLVALKLLYSLSILQVFNGDADAVSILEDLMQDQDSTTSDMNVNSVIEILLGYLARPSSLFRKMAEQVFGAIAGDLDADALESLLDILGKSENITGQQELFENNDDEADELSASGSAASDSSATSTTTNEDGESDADVTNDEDDEEDSDVEVVLPNGDRSRNGVQVGEDEDDDDDDSVSDSSAVSSEASSTSTEDNDDDNDEVTDFERKLAQTLRTNKTTGAEDSATSDESDMDDDQMLALDSHLINIFKQRTQQDTKRKDSKDAKENVVNFKNRVLDLLTIYCKTCNANTLTLNILIPLIVLSRTTNNKALSERAAGVLRTWFDTCNKLKTFPDGVDPEALVQLLAKVHDELRHVSSKQHGALAGRSALFIVKMLVNKDAAHYARVADMYASLQKEWYADRKSKIPPSAFTEWTSWSINSRRSR